MSVRVVASVVAGVLVALCAGDSTPSIASPDPASEPPRAGTRDPLRCPGGEALGVALDIPGPGRATPERAAAPYAGGGVTLLLVSERSRTATVHAMTQDGRIGRIFRLTEHDDGWWPDGYSQCLSELPPT